MATLYAGVDLGGTNVTCALAEADGRVICESKAPTLSAAIALARSRGAITEN